MTRLRHSLSAYRRAMQMSQAVLYVFVEGGHDRYVYSQFAARECEPLATRYCVVAAEELPGAHGGKQALLGVFDYLRRRSSLIDTFKGKTTVALFVLDKDLDDWQRKKRRSEHVVYTETYELENYLFLHGQLSEAAAASASLDIGLIRAGLGQYAQWRQRAAATWKEWVKLCVFSHTRKIRSMCNYGRATSPINHVVDGRVNDTEYRRLRSALQRNSGLSPDEFERSFRRLARRIEALYSEGKHDLVFKGKWYTRFLVQDVQRIAGRRRFKRHGLEGRVLSGLAQTLDFNGTWGEYFRAPIRRLLDAARQS